MYKRQVLPFGLVQGPRGVLDGLNLVGLKRRGVDRSDITVMRDAYHMVASGEVSFLDRARRLAEETDSPYAVSNTHLDMDKRQEHGLLHVEEGGFQHR